MKFEEAFPDTFKNLRRQLGLKEPHRRPMVETCRADDSELCLQLTSRYGFTEKAMHRAAERYRLGKSRSGKTIYWMIDRQGRLHDGHIGDSWVTQMLKSRCPDLARYVMASHCLFGLHLLKPDVDVSVGVPSSPVCIVESEPSAVVLSELYPQSLWMAYVSPVFFNAELLEPLQGHHVTLFPRTDAEMDNYLFCCELADQARRACHLDITVSTFLEDHASARQKAAKIDLVDFLF
ncbi:MAG: hypothetical protein II886_08820 [Prevotella sp.]|nr:hypothetical protein [Prevotella sp.]MBQ3699997.1 hypothetical protein [Prevotella sp.]